MGNCKWTSVKYPVLVSVKPQTVAHSLAFGRHYLGTIFGQEGGAEKQKEDGTSYNTTHLSLKEATPLTMRNFKPQGNLNRWVTEEFSPCTQPQKSKTYFSWRVVLGLWRLAHFWSPKWPLEELHTGTTSDFILWFCCMVKEAGFTNGLRFTCQQLSELKVDWPGVVFVFADVSS